MSANQANAATFAFVTQYSTAIIPKYVSQNQMMEILFNAYHFVSWFAFLNHLSPVLNSKNSQNAVHLNPC